MARLYTPRGPASAQAWILFASACLGLALVLAGTWQYLGSIGELPIAGVFARGSLIAGFSLWALRKARLARPWSSAAIVAGSVLVAVVGSDYLKYQEARQEVQEEAHLQREISLSVGRDSSEVEQEYREDLAVFTFPRFLRGRLLPQGLSLLFAMAAAGYVVMGFARDPSCVRCARFLREDQRWEAALGQWPQVQELLLSDGRERLPKLRELFSPPDTPERTIYSHLTCPQGHASGDTEVLRIEELLVPRAQTRVQRHRADLLVSSEELTAIRESLALSTRAGEEGVA